MKFQNTNMQKQNWLKVLKILSKNQFVSGTEIAKLLGMSRTSVWKSIHALQDEGFIIDAVTSRGYILRDEIEVLETDLILEHMLSLGVKVDDCIIEIFPQIESTNTYLMGLNNDDVQDGQNLIDQKNIPFRVCLAESQTKGKGRLGRQWLAPFASSILLSFKWNLTGPVNDLSGLSIALGVAAIEALQKLGLHGLELKWPNDIYYQDKKLAGLIVELQSDAAQTKVVVGLGLNIHLRHSNTTTMEQVLKPYCDLFSVQKKMPARNLIVAYLLKEFRDCMNEFARSGLRKFIDSFCRVDYLKGKKLKVTQSERSILEGVGMGINERGELIMRLDNEEACAISYGDIQILK